MSLFNHNSDFSQLEWRLLQNSCLNLYVDESKMDNHTKILKESNYKVIEFDVRAWNKKEDIDNAFLKIGVPYNNCSNLDAMKDCVAEMNLPDMSDAVMVLRGFDNLIEKLGKDYAEGFLDVISLEARKYLLFGVRLVVLLSVSEDIKFYAKLGGTYITPHGF